MRGRFTPLLIFALWPMLMGAVVTPAKAPIFRSVPMAIYKDLGTAGQPRHLPDQVFRTRYARYPELCDAVAQYYDQDFHTAFRTLNALDDVQDAEVLAWRALICFRQGNYAEAAATARRSLALDSDLGLAHLALAQAHDLTRHSFAWASRDTMLHHIRRTTELAPTLPTAWNTLWMESQRDGDTETERAALAGLYGNRCFTPGLLEYSRWVLKSQPDGALLLTNGDDDTYPLAALQQEESLRPDVAVVNISMLNLPNYALLVAERAGLPWPRNEAHLKEALPGRGADGGLVSQSMLILDRWALMYRRGELPRPLTWALTVPPRSLPGNLPNEGRYIGGCVLYVPDLDGPLVDFGKVQASFQGIDQKKMMGNFVCPLDTSPIRAAGGNFLAGNPIALYLRYGYQGLKEGHKGRARMGLTGAGLLMRHGQLEDVFEDQLFDLGGLLWEVENDGGE